MLAGMVKGKFSVVIPTLQRSPELWPLVDQLAAHPLVHEVLVINNAPEPLSWGSPKVRVLQQAENIYVNPAWNLGAREAQAEFLAIINDDVRFDDEVLDYTAALLTRRGVGLVGPDGAFVNRPGVPLSDRLATIGHVTAGMGIFLALRRDDYRPLPDGPLIWGGDDWLFYTSPAPPRVLHGGGFVTDMSTTTASPEFQALRDLDRRRAEVHLRRVKWRRWWHVPVALLAVARRARGRVGR